MIALSYAALFFCLEGAALTVLALWLDPRARLNRIAALVGALASFWGFCLVFELAADVQATAVFFARLSLILEFWINPAIAWLLLVLVPIPRRWRSAVLIPFCLTAALVFADFWFHGLSSVSLVPGPWGNAVSLAQGTPWFTVADALFLGLYLVCAVSLIRARFAIRSQRQRHLIKITLLGLAVTLPLIEALNYGTDTLGLPNLRFLPGIVLIAVNGYLIFRYRYLRQPMPALEEGFSEALREPAFLLDSQGKVLGCNEAGREFFGPDGNDLVGNEFARLLGDPSRFRLLWKSAEDRQEQFDPTGLAPLKSFSPHYDRFGDFLGALVLLETGQEPPEALHGLSEREQEILGLLVDGHSYQSIASRLFISPGTVKRHAHNILQKTGSKDRKALYREFGGARR